MTSSEKGTFLGQSLQRIAQCNLRQSKRKPGNPGNEERTLDSKGLSVWNLNCSPSTFGSHPQGWRQCQSVVAPKPLRSAADVVVASGFTTG